MAKSDLLKEAIADAKAVKETALANAKIALEEAFAPRIQSMLTAKISEDLAEEDMEAPEDITAPVDEHDVMYQPEEGGEMDAAAEMDMEAPAPEMDAEMDMEAPAPEMEAPADDMSMEGMYMNDADEDPTDANSKEDLELEAIIRELEEDLDEDVTEEVLPEAVEEEPAKADKDSDDKIEEDFNIDEIIEEILSEDDEIVTEAEHEEDEKEAPKEKMEEISTELDEAYDTIHSLKDTINEVNLLNAKLLFSNKLFRNYPLSESQKMKVIENFDRASNLREVKLIFSTLSESFTSIKTKRSIKKESFASKASGTTAPSEPTKQIINEGNQLANRWKKLAGLL